MEQEHLKVDKTISTDKCHSCRQDREEESELQLPAGVGADGEDEDDNVGQEGAEDDADHGETPDLQGRQACAGEQRNVA